jgi:hypothetical protein
MPKDSWDRASEQLVSGHWMQRAKVCSVQVISSIAAGVIIKAGE